MSADKLIAGEDVVKREFKISAEKARIAGLVLPAIIIVIVCLVIPLGWLSWKSVYDEEITLRHYLRIVSDPAYRQTFIATFEISFIVTLICAILGYIISYVLAQLPRRTAIIGITLVLIPFWTSLLVRTYAWLVLLQAEGLINKIIIGLGLSSTPIPLVHNTTGTVIGMVHILMPFLILPLYANMLKVDKDLLRAAVNLGASARYTFWRVFFPLTIPGLMAGIVLVFVLCLGFYVTPELLGGGRTIMISMLIQRNVELFYEWGAASSVSVVLLFIVFLLFILVRSIVPVADIFGSK